MEELRLDQGLSKPRSDIQTTEQLVGYGADSSNGDVGQPGFQGDGGRGQDSADSGLWRGIREAALHQVEWKYFTIKHPVWL